MRKYLIFLIIFLGLVLRLAGLSSFPPSLNWDEVSLGYNAYSLLLTGRDEWGVRFPTIFRAYGDYKLPVYVYAAVLPIKLLGLNEFSVRLPSAITGTLTILVAYVLAFGLFQKRQLALVAALLVALEPWTLFLSRLALEANIATLLLTLGLALLVYRRPVWSVFFFGLSVWAYNSARVFVPLFLLTYGLANRRRIKFSLPLLIIAGFFFVPMFWSLFSIGGQARFRWLNILDSGAIATIEHDRTTSPLPPPLPRLLYNRPVYFILTAAGNYFKYFLPDFLFITGGDHYQFSVQQHGLLYLINFPLFYLGIYYLFRNWKMENVRLLIIWLFLAPLPGSLVRDAPHTLRAVTLLPLPMIVSAYGLWRVVTHWRRLLPMYLLVILASFGLYVNKALTVYSPGYSRDFQYGYKQLTQYIKESYDRYDQIIVTKYYAEPHEFILFYWPWNPSFYRSDPQLDRYGRSDWFWVDAFAKFRFVNDWEMVDVVASLSPDKKYLIAASPAANPSATDLTRINFLDGSPAFLIKEK